MGPSSSIFERNGAGLLLDRIYTVHFSCKDLAGNASTSTATVMVPSDQGI